MAPDDLKANFRKVTESHEAIISFLEEKNQESLVSAVTKHATLFHLRVLNYLSPFPSLGGLENFLKADEVSG